MTNETTPIAYDPNVFGELLSQDPQDVRDRILRRIADAPDFESACDVLEGKTSQNQVNRVFAFLDVQWAPYESDRGFIPLAICNVVDNKTGETSEFVTTSEVLTALIRKAELTGAFPFVRRIVAKNTNSGQKALNFERV